MTKRLDSHIVKGKKMCGDWRLAIGDWRLGTGDWGLVTGHLITGYWSLLKLLMAEKRLQFLLRYK
jgi:hypothetical protein